MADKLMGLGAEPVCLSLVQTKPVADGAVEEAYRTTRIIHGLYLRAATAWMCF